MKINFNDSVRVKLTDWGKEVYFHQFDELNKFITSHGGTPIKPNFPEADENGYTRIQLWQFMEIFGQHIGMCKDPVALPLEFLYEEGKK